MKPSTIARIAIGAILVLGLCIGGSFVHVYVAGTIVVPHHTVLSLVALEIVAEAVALAVALLAMLAIIMAACGEFDD